MIVYYPDITQQYMIDGIIVNLNTYELQLINECCPELIADQQVAFPESVDDILYSVVKK